MYESLPFLVACIYECGKERWFRSKQTCFIGFWALGVSLCLLTVYLAMFIPFSSSILMFFNKMNNIHKKMFVIHCIVYVSLIFSRRQQWARVLACDTHQACRLCMGQTFLHVNSIVCWLAVPMLMLRVLYSGSGILHNYPVEEVLRLRW